MENFEFRVTQPATTFFDASIIIKASSEKAAINKLRKMSQHQLDSMCENWEMADGADVDGNIEVWDNNGQQII
jgi:hypothetical protein